MTVVADAVHTGPNARRAGSGAHSQTFRPDIEGLRGIAVLVVVAFHCGLPWLGGGFVGVDVFFVLSGYLITSLLVREAQERSRISLLDFYARRMRRLLPAAAVTLLVTLLVGMAVFAPQELTFAARAGRAAAVYLSNVFFAVNAADYFGPRVELNPILHTWSLAVEEQFYLFWPILIVLGLQWWRSKRALVALLVTLTAASLAVCVWFTMRGGTFAFYALPARAWEFGIGGLAALIVHPVGGRMASWIAPAGWVGLLLVIASAVAIDRTMAFPGWIALVPVAGTCAALVAGAQSPRGGLCRILGIAPLQTLGKLSYSWYLWHWPVLVFASVLVPAIGLVGKVVAAAMAFVLAAITHRLIENPIRFHPALVRRPVASIAVGFALTATSLAAGVGALWYARTLAGTPEMRVLAEAAGDIARLPRSQCVTLGVATDVKTCDFGDPNSRVRVVLFGDSHAIHWFNPIEAIARERRWKLTTVLKSGCAATDMVFNGDDGGSCASWRPGAFRTIVSLRPAAVVLGSYTNRPARANDPYLSALTAGTRRTLAVFAAAGIPALVIRDVPRFSFDVPTCLARAKRLGWLDDRACDVAADEALHAGVFDAERAAAASLRGVRFMDLSAVLCPGGVCRAAARGRPMYRDDNHLTGGFAESLRNEVARALVPIVQPASARANGI